MNVTSYRDLVVWQKAMSLVIAVYELTDHFPTDELYGLTSQMRRAAISIPSNIAEGSRRGSRRDFRHFLLNAYGSGAELETQLEITRHLAWSDDIDFTKVDGLLGEVMRMLNAMTVTLHKDVR